jgi:anti-sigma factor RsiW
MKTWTCDELERWLDEGLPPETRGLGEAHVQQCARCREALAAAGAVEGALRLREPSPRAPAGFTDAVMQRVSVARHAATPSTVRAGSLLGWAVGDTATTAFCALALLVGWWGAPLWALAVAISGRVVALAAALSVFVLTPPAALDAFASPAVLGGLALALLPAIAWGSWLLMRWSQRVTGAGV